MDALTEDHEVGNTASSTPRVPRLRRRTDFADADSDAMPIIGAAARDALALVLAGGRGTRLGALTSDRVKPAVPFGGKYRLVDFPLSNCINSGIRRVGVLTQYKAHSLIRHLQSAWSFLRPELNEFVELMPAQQRTGSGWYSGTADAVYQNIDIIRAHAPQNVLVLGGDHIYKMDYGEMLWYHAQRGAAVTVGCVEVPTAEAHEFGVAVTDEDGYIREFQEKVAQPAEIPGYPGHSLASMGIYVFDAAHLLRVLAEDHAREDSDHDFGKDILPSMIAAGDRVFAFPFRDLQGNRQGYWRDVGNLDAYHAANLELTGVTPPLDLYDRDWPIWTHQEQAPPAKFVFDEPERRGHAIDSLISGGCIISGGAVRRSLLFSFVRVGEGSTLEEVVVLPGARIGRNVHLRRAIVETGCVIADGTVVGFDAALDAKRFQLSAKGVALITPEMLNQHLSYVR